MAADKRLATISSHLQPRLSQGEKYRQSLLDNLRQASIFLLHVCTSAIPCKAISELFIGLRKMVYLTIGLKKIFLNLDSISIQWATLLDHHSTFTAIRYPIPDRGKETGFNKVVGIYIIVWLWSSGKCLEATFLLLVEQGDTS